MLFMTIIGHHKASFNPKLPHKAWDAKVLLPYSILLHLPMSYHFPILQTPLELQALKQPYEYQWNHPMYLPCCIDFKVPYEGQPSTMKSLAHSNKIFVKHAKETQKVHQTHATNAKN